MGHIARAYPKTPKPPKPKCEATVENYRDGTSYNLARPFTIPKHQQCSRYAKSKVGKFCFCELHTQFALKGLITEAGVVATRAALADVRRYPAKFPNGLFSWARNLKPEKIE